MNGLKVIIAILVLGATVYAPIAQAQIVPAQLAQLEPEDYAYYVNRGVIKYNSGDYKGAIEDYDQAIRLSPKGATAYSNRGAARAASGKYRLAIADYTYAIILAPDSSMAYSNRGVSREAIKDYQGAIADYTKAIELKPSSTRAYLNRASLRVKLGDNKGAMARERPPSASLTTKSSIVYFCSRERQAITKLSWKRFVN
ncbi:tetratricopeptide repeat protein (plasmid) [Nostoc sp. UHCC 0302]|uniref:tetratricopeptide repeat protein n=1 Tax=Nostoc sp. UHCC 0302 TaxID=3134896 RepID=UPI00311C977A